MPGKKDTLLFIPDISGFTDFVNRTEIDHSRHIISEVLEIIINSDLLNMTVSEIEGDAVLFFKDEVPSVADLIDQCKHTFIQFHDHLNRYDTERICRCGACETASSLSLKFIVHQGIVETISIKEHQKLHGSDVIKAHQLLKNSIEEHEYILLTEKFINNDGLPGTANSEGLKILHGSDSYNESDTISYSYIPLKGVREQMKEPSRIRLPELSEDKIQFEKTIHAPIDLIYENFTDFDKRKEWNDRIRDTVLHGSNLNRTGSLHTCLIGSNSLDIDTLGREETSNRIVYGERLNEFKGLRDIITIYTFEKKGEKTLVRAEVDYKIKSWFSRLMKPVVRKIFSRQTENGLNRLKQASENIE